MLFPCFIYYIFSFFSFSELKGGELSEKLTKVSIIAVSEVSAATI